MSFFTVGGTFLCCHTIFSCDYLKILSLTKYSCWHWLQIFEEVRTSGPKWTRHQQEKLLLRHVKYHFDSEILLWLSIDKYTAHHFHLKLLESVELKPNLSWVSWNLQIDVFQCKKKYSNLACKFIVPCWQQKNMIFKGKFYSRKKRLKKWIFKPRNSLIVLLNDTNILTLKFCFYFALWIV